MRRKTKKRLKKIIFVSVLVIAACVCVKLGIYDNLIATFGNIEKEAEKVVSATTQSAGSGVENLKRIYEEYLSSSEDDKNKGSNVASSVKRIEGLEIPSYLTGHEVVRHTGYTLSWNEENLVADWVAYELTSKELDTQEVSRTEDFRPDPSVKKSSQLEDYRNSGYSRGHLAPAQDFKWSENAMSDTFYLTNMVPQKQDNYNAGIWLSAENAVRDSARITGSVYVVTGPVLTDGPYETIGKNKVTIPKECYKALLVIDENDEAHTIAMSIPQTAGKKEKINKYLLTVNELESLTGVDFFPELDDSIEETVEGTYDLNFWPKSFR